MAMKRHSARCHCGKVGIEADLDLMAGTVRCNCSSCAKARWWEASMKPEAVHAIRGEEHTVSYRFGARAIDMRHCRHCGVRLFIRGHMELLGGDFVAVNVACLETASDDELAAAPIHHADGRHDNWTQAPAIFAHL
jgi:hypothetical protein